MRFIDVLLLLIISLSVCYFKIKADDHWWHIAAGRSIISQGHIVDHEEFSFTHDGKAWNNFEWLYDIFIATVWDHYGVGGLYVSRVCVLFVLLLITYLTLLKVATRHGLRPNPDHVLLMTLFVLIIHQGRLGDRPHSYSYVFLSLFVYFIYNTMNIYGNHRRMLFLLPVIIIWRNIHASWVLGIVLWGAALMDFVLLRYKAKTIKSSEILESITIFMIVLVGGIFLSPQPFDISLYTGHQFQTNAIAEWQPFFSTWTPDPYSFAFVIFSIMFVVVVAGDFRSKPFLSSFLLLMLLQSLTKVRFVSEFTILAAPLIYSKVTRWQSETTENPSLISVCRSALLLVALLVALTANFYLMGNEWGMGVSVSQNPVHVADYLQDINAKGNLLSNDLPPHAYIIFRKWPDLRIFIDGRVPPVYSADFLSKFERLSLTEITQEYIIDYILFQGPIFSTEPDRFFDERTRRHYCVVYFDTFSVLYMRKEIIEKYNNVSCFSVLNPWRLTEPEYIERISLSPERAILIEELSHYLQISKDPEMAQAIKNEVDGRLSAPLF